MSVLHVADVSDSWPSLGFGSVAPCTRRYAACFAPDVRLPPITGCWSGCSRPYAEVIARNHRVCPGSSGLDGKRPKKTQAPTPRNRAKVKYRAVPRQI
jgi:hypothetical protein